MPPKCESLNCYIIKRKKLDEATKRDKLAIEELKKENEHQRKFQNELEAKYVKYKVEKEAECKKLESSLKECHKE